MLVARGTYSNRGWQQTALWISAFGDLCITPLSSCPFVFFVVGEIADRDDVGGFAKVSFRGNDGRGRVWERSETVRFVWNALAPFYPTSSNSNRNCSITGFASRRSHISATRLGRPLAVVFV